MNSVSRNFHVAAVRDEICIMIQYVLRAKGKKIKRYDIIKHLIIFYQQSIHITK